MRNKVKFVVFLDGEVMVVGRIGLDLQWWCRLGDAGYHDKWSPGWRWPTPAKVGGGGGDLVS